MKQLFYVVMCLVAFGFLFSCSTKSTDLNELEVVTETDAQMLSVNIPPSSLPQAILDYVAANYPTSTIIEAEEDTDSSGNLTYELHLDTGEELVFAPDGTLLAVGDDNDDDGDGTNDDDDGGLDDDDDGDNGTPIDVGALPVSIIEYASFNYPGAVIVFAEIEGSGEYEIYLDNGVELHFDANGNFLSASSDDDDDGITGTSDDDDTGTSDDDDTGTSDDDDTGTSDDDDTGNGTDDDDGDGVDDDGVADNDDDD